MNGVQLFDEPKSAKVEDERMKILDKICKRSVWVLLTVFFAIWFVVFTVGKPIAMKNDGWINGYFDINPWEMVKDENDDPLSFIGYMYLLIGSS